VAKRRKSATEVESMAVIGEIRGKNVLLVDDLTETAGTLTTAAVAEEKGRKEDRGLRFPRHPERCGHRKIAKILY
jgi:hypoxanthine phosphoribosyltransferase